MNQELLDYFRQELEQDSQKYFHRNPNLPICLQLPIQIDELVQQSTLSYEQNTGNKYMKDDNYNILVHEMYNIWVIAWQNIIYALTIFTLQNQDKKKEMQNLKVYLSTKYQKEKASIDKLKQNIKQRIAPLQINIELQKIHHPHILSKSTESRQHQSQQHMTNHTTNNNSTNIYHAGITGISYGGKGQHPFGIPSVQIKKKNGCTVNRSLQQLYDFRQDVRNIIGRDALRYGRETSENKDGKPLTQGKRKNSKQILSDSKLQYRSQTHASGKYHRNQKSVSDIQGKDGRNSVQNIQNIYGAYGTKPQLKIRVVDKQKQRSMKKNGSSNNNQKQPIKKRSTSANPDKKTNPQPKQQHQQKKNRSYSLKKVSKNHENSIYSNAGQSQKQTINLLENQQIIFRCMFRTRKGIQIMNPNKVNQDRFYIKQNTIMSNQKNMSIFAVADGHGPLGHHVSHLIMDNLHRRFDAHLKNHRNVENSLERTYTQIQNMLGKNVEFNADFSGSTLVTVVVDEDMNVVCANVGDSRAIVAKQLSKTNWEVIRLSNDHKPGLEEEKNRILALGGRIQTVYDEDGKSIGPLRVWLPKKQIQGLAMSRSLGDNISKPIGVTHLPQILTHKLTKDDKFLLLASDGVWQFLTNYQILSLIIPYYRQNRLEDACEALMRQAYKSWTVEDNTVVDDITFILVFLSVQDVDREVIAVNNINKQGTPKSERKQEQNSGQDSLNKLHENPDTTQK